MPGFRPPELPSVEQLVKENTLEQLDAKVAEARKRFDFGNKALAVCWMLLIPTDIAAMLFTPNLELRWYAVLAMMPLLFAGLTYVAVIRQREIVNNVELAQAKKDSEEADALAEKAIKNH